VTFGAHEDLVLLALLVALAALLVLALMSRIPYAILLVLRRADPRLRAGDPAARAAAGSRARGRAGIELATLGLKVPCSTN
jgi:hypothetical protein